MTKPDSFSRIILTVFSGVAILMFVIAGSAAFYTVRALAKEKSVVGRVTHLVMRPDQNGQVFYYPVVAFNLQNGEPATVQLTEGSWPAAYTEGQAVSIAYDPAQPNTARIKSFSSTLGMWILPLITGGLGVAFSLATAFAYWMLKATNVNEPSIAS
ncbi:MAG: DUF3592 domain-containing protein [Caldilineaceae bacterium]